MVSNPIEPAKKRKKNKDQAQDKGKRGDHLGQRSADALQDPLTTAASAATQGPAGIAPPSEADKEQDQDTGEQDSQETEKKESETVDAKHGADSDPLTQGTGGEDSGSGKGPGDPSSGGPGKGEGAPKGGGGGAAPANPGAPKEGGGGGVSGEAEGGQVDGGDDKIAVKDGEQGAEGEQSQALDAGGDASSEGGGGSKSTSTLTPQPIAAAPPAPVLELGGDGGLILGDAAIDQMLLQATGMSSRGHMDMLNQQSQQLSTAVTQSNSLIASSGMALQSTSLNLGMSLSSGLGGITSAAGNDLKGTFDKVKGQVDGAISGALSLVGGAIAAAAAQVAATSSKQQTEEQKAFDAAQTVLTASKSQWEGSYQTTVLAQAKKVRALGVSFSQIASGKEKDHRAKFEALGNGGPEDALKLAYERGCADTYKRYAPEFKKYGDHAGKFLDGMAAKAGDLSDKLLAPTLDSLYPLAQSNAATMATDSEQLGEHVKGEGESFRTSMDSVQQSQAAALDAGGQDALSEVDSASKSLQTSTDASLDTLVQDQRLAVDQIQSTRLDFISAIDETQAQLSDSTDAVVFEQGKQELISQLDSDTGVVLQTLKQDADSAQLFVQEKHQVQSQVIQDQSAAHSQRVLKAGDQSLAAVDTALTGTQGQLTSLMTQGDAIYSTLGSNTVLQAKESTDAVDTTSKEYQAELLKQLDTYTQGVVQNLLNLQSKSMVAADAAGKTATATQKTALKARSVAIYKAIDGWGTDESTLLKQLTGLTKSEAEYTAARYKDKAGTSLRQAIIDDTSDGDNVRTASLAYLKGDRAKGAKYALKYASEGILRIFGADMDLVNHTMSGMDEVSRTKLLKDPAFPAIKDKIQNPTIAMGPAGLLSPLTSGMAAGTAFFGPGKYDLDAFAALSDPSKTLDEAKKDVKVINLAKAFDTDSMNPFKWGTDEAKVWAILGSMQGAELEAFKAKFKAYKGVSLEDEIDDEFGGYFENDLEYKRAKALAAGDKAKADAYALELSLDKGKEQQVFGQLENANLVAAQSGGQNDWLANKKAVTERSQLNSAYETQTGSAIESDIKSKLKGEGEHAEDIAMAHLKGKSADPKHLLAYAIIRGGTDEVYAQKAIKQLLSDIQAAKAKDPQAGKKAWKLLKIWFATNYKIHDLEKYMGVGADKNVYSEQLTELDGQERQDFNDVLDQVLAEPDNVNDEFARVKKKWEWYRGKGAGAVGSFVTDLYSDSGGDLDNKLKKLEEMMADTSWYDSKTGKPADLKGPRYTEFKKYVALLDEMGGIYKDQREAVTNAITTVITTVAAIVSTIVTAGALGPLWVGIAISAGAAGLNMMIKSSMKGNSYGPGEALTDFANVAGQALVGMVTAGIGPAKFKQFGKFLSTMADKSAKMKVLSEIIKSAPGELQGLLMNETTWTGDWDSFVALLGVSSFKMVVGSAGGVANDGLAGKVAGPGKKWLSAMGSTITEIVSDPVVMSGDNIGMAMLTKSIEKLVGTAGGQVSLAMVSRKLNKLPNIEPALIDKLGKITDDAAADLQGRLLPQHQLILHNAHPQKYKKPDFGSVQLDLLDASKAVTEKMAKEQAKQKDAIEQGKSNTVKEDPNQLKLAFPEAESVKGEAETAVEPKAKTPPAQEAQHHVAAKAKTSSPKQKTSAHVSEDADAGVADKKRAELNPEHTTKSNSAKDDGVSSPLNHLPDPTLAAALHDIHGIGPVLSDRIMEERKKGPFKSPQDLQDRVKQIGPVLSARIIGKIKGRTELHNHQAGVFEVEDLVSMYTSGGDGGKTELLDQLHQGVPKLEAALKKAQGKLASAKTPAQRELFEAAVAKSTHTLDTVKRLLAERDNVNSHLTQDQLLGQLLNAGTLNYDQAYAVRRTLDSKKISGGAKQYFEVLLTRLAKQGVSYIELTGGQGDKISSQDLRSIMDQTGVEVRFLKSVRARQTLGSDDQDGAAETIKKNTDIAMSDEGQEAHFVGIDYLGAEPEFRSEGMEAFKSACLELHRNLDPSQTAVVRVHVGEGYFTEGMSKQARQAETKKVQQNIQDLIESLEVVLPQTKEGAKLDVRAGHVTHASDAQLKRLTELGVHMEVNLGSNLKTGTLQEVEAHPLLKMLYFGSKLSINTDAGAMMGTTLHEEYSLADKMLRRFVAGKINITLDDDTVITYSSLKPAEKKRFDVQYLEKMSREYQQIDRSGL